MSPNKDSEASSQKAVIIAQKRNEKLQTGGSPAAPLELGHGVGDASDATERVQPRDREEKAL